MCVFLSVVVYVCVYENTVVEGSRETSCLDMRRHVIQLLLLAGAAKLAQELSA